MEKEHTEVWECNKVDSDFKVKKLKLIVEESLGNKYVYVKQTDLEEFEKPILLGIVYKETQKGIHVMSHWLNTTPTMIFYNSKDFNKKKVEKVEAFQLELKI